MRRSTPCGFPVLNDSVFSLILPPPPKSTLFPYTTLFRSRCDEHAPITQLIDYEEFCNPVQKTDITPAELRSEEHTSELQSQSNLVCRLLLEKKNTVD